MANSNLVDRNGTYNGKHIQGIMNIVPKTVLFQPEDKRKKQQKLKGYIWRCSKPQLKGKIIAWKNIHLMVLAQQEGVCLCMPI